MCLFIAAVHLHTNKSTATSIQLHCPQEISPPFPTPPTYSTHHTVQHVHREWESLVCPVCMNLRFRNALNCTGRKQAPCSLLGIRFLLALRPLTRTPVILKVSVTHEDWILHNNIKKTCKLYISESNLNCI